LRDAESVGRPLRDDRCLASIDRPTAPTLRPGTRDSDRRG